MNQRYARPHDAANPWGLTPWQVQALRAVIEQGGLKAAGRALAVDFRTVESHVGKARRKMGVTLRLRHFILFDRWDQQAGQSA